MTEISVRRGYALTSLVALHFGACQSGRLLLGLLTEPIKVDLSLSDAQLGILTGISVGLAYSVFLLPSARLADRANRQWCLLSFGLAYLLGTVLSAVAPGFWELLAARTLVAASEACLLSLSISLIADLLPPAKRPMGFSLFTSAITLMIFFNFIVAGWLEANIGWRAVFGYFGAGYALLLACAAIVVRDPARLIQTATPPLRTVLRSLIGKPTFLMLVGVACLYVFAIMAAITWTPAFLIRVHDLTQLGAANFMAASVGIAAGAVTLASGVVLTRARRHSIAGPLRVAMWVAVGVIPLYLFGLLAPGAPALVCLGTALAASPIVNAAIMSSVQEIAQPSYRATAAALVILPDTIIGGGAGAFVTGLLSDLGSAHYGDDSIRHALSVTTGVAWALAATLYWRSTKSIERDARDAGKPPAPSV